MKEDKQQANDTSCSPRTKATDIIKHYMQQNRISYAELASRIGKSTQGVWIALNGKNESNPDASREAKYSTIKKMCDALDLRIVVKEKKVETTGDVLNAEIPENMPFSAVQKLLESVGYKVLIEKSELQS